MLRIKFYLIALINYRSKILAILGIRVMVKLGNITYWIELEDRSKGKKKARFENFI